MNQSPVCLLNPPILLICGRGVMKVLILLNNTLTILSLRLWKASVIPLVRVVEVEEV